MTFSSMRSPASDSSTRLASSRSKRRPRSSPSAPRSNASSAPARSRDSGVFALGSCSTRCITDAGTPICWNSVPSVWPLCTRTTCHALPATAFAALSASGGNGRLSVVRVTASPEAVSALENAGTIVATRTVSDPNRPATIHCSRDQ